jgi:double zinc ribbon protein
VEDLSRFFRQMVRNLAATDPARLRSPLPLGEIRGTILPYRANRRALRLETSEDYELVLIRLCAGEGGFARTEPDDVHAEFAAEALNSNPDLTIVHRHENAVVILNEEQLVRALDPARELAFAPSDQRFAPPAPREPASVPDPLAPAREVSKPPAELLPPAICRACSGKLPPGRSVKFCPHCGASQALTHCPECQTELEPAWRHCVACGAAVRRD